VTPALRDVRHLPHRAESPGLWPNVRMVSVFACVFCFVVPFLFPPRRAALPQFRGVVHGLLFHRVEPLGLLCMIMWVSPPPFVPLPHRAESPGPWPARMVSAFARAFYSRALSYFPLCCAAYPP
jgi:hypothetical protein